MALNIGTLAGYVEENAFELMSKAVLETNLAQYITIRAGLQGNNVSIPLLADDFVTSPTLQDLAADPAVQGNYRQNYATCGWTANGTTSLTEVNMDLYHAQVQRAYCVQTLRDTFLSRQLSAGAANGAESLPFESVAADYFTKGITKFNEAYLINGAAAIGSNTFVGIQGQLAAAVGTGTIPATQALNQLPWTSGATTAAVINALEAALAIYEAMPAELMMRDDNVLVVNPADYKALVGAMVKENLYHYGVDAKEVFIPATNIRVVASSGISSAAALSGVYFKFLTSGANIIMGTDLTSDFDEFKVWYSQDNDEVRSSMKWTVGVSVVQPELVVCANEQ